MLTLTGDPMEVCRGPWCASVQHVQILLFCKIILLYLPIILHFVSLAGHLWKPAEQLIQTEIREISLSILGFFMIGCDPEYHFL